MENYVMRKLFLTLHLWLGLASGLIIVIVATTGALYVFEEELRDAFQSHLLYVPKDFPESAQVKASEVLAIMKRDAGHEKIQQIRFRTLEENSPQAAAILVFTKNRHVYSLNPYSGCMMGVRDLKSDVISIVIELHTELLLGRVGMKDVGEQIVKWNVLIFFVMLLTGIVVWMPTNIRFAGDVLKNALKNSFRVNWQGNVVKRSYDLHRVAGFYAFAVMFMVAWTGIFWMFDSVEDSVYAAFGEKKVFEKKPSSVKPTQKISSAEKTAVLDRAHAEVLRYGSPQLVNIQIPQKETESLRVFARYPYRFIRKQSVFYFDQNAGNLVKSDLHENYTTPDKIRVSNFDIHTGRMFGLPSKILWFMAALFTASLPITGTTLWWKKMQRKRRTKHSRKMAAPEKEPSAPAQTQHPAHAEKSSTLV